MLRFLLSPRWIGLALFAGIIASVSVYLGNWQFDRRSERAAENQLVISNLGKPPVALDSVVSPGGVFNSDAEWTPVQISGNYLSELEVTLKYQTRNSGAGVEVVTPLQTDSGAVVLVNRGWMPSSNTTAKPENIEPATTGRVTVTGWLRRNSTAEGQAIRVSEGQVRAISSVGLGEWVGKEMYPGFIDLYEQEPNIDSELKLRPDPDLSGGPHFFYALQWYFFAGLAIFGYFYFAWSEWKTIRGASRQSDQI